MLPDCRQLFPFNTDIINLDHGGFGGTSTEILAARAKILEDIEAFPPRAFFDDGEKDYYRHAWRDATKLIAKRFAAGTGDIALISNVTDGVNALLYSLSFNPGDEIVIGSLAYGAVINAVETIAARQGAHLIQAHFKFPQPRAEQCIESLTSVLTPRTRLVILDHITSGTALILPVTDMVKICRERGIPVLVDGAHAPGNVPVNLTQLNPDWYVANLHKWYFVPRSCGFLWARHDRQENLKPAILSWDIHERFPRSFEWTGTRDPSSFMSIPAAFAFMDRFGESEVRRHNHSLILEGLELLSRAWGATRETPQEMIANMSLIPLHHRLSSFATDDGRRRIQGTLWKDYKIACPCILHDEQLYLRISAQIYNQIQDYERLDFDIRTMAAS